MNSYKKKLICFIFNLNMDNYQFYICRFLQFNGVIQIEQLSRCELECFSVILKTDEGCYGRVYNGGLEKENDGKLRYVLLYKVSL